MKPIRMMKMLSLALSFGYVSAGSSLAAPISAAESRFVVLKEGNAPESGLFTRKQTKVIQTQADYKAELSRYTSAAPGTVDFSKGRVVLIDMGPRQSGGFSLKVAAVNISPNAVTVNLELIVPGPQCMVTAALTNPYQFIFIPTQKEILVSEKLVAATC